MSFPRSSLLSLLWVLLASGAGSAAPDEAPFTQVLPSVAILEWESASPGALSAKPVYTTAVAVRLSDERTVILSSCVGLGERRPAAVLVREDKGLSRLAVEPLGVDLSTGLAVVSGAWTAAQPVSISEGVSPEVGEKLYFVAMDPKGGLELAEGFACESDIRQLGILRYERLTRTSCTQAQIPPAAAVFDSQGRLFGFAVGAGSRLPVSCSVCYYVNPVRAWIGVLEELSRTGKVSRAWLGLALRQHLDGSGKKAGAVVEHVLSKSPAEKAGIAPGDLITAYESDNVRHEVCCVTDLTFEIASMKPGTMIAVHLTRNQQEIPLSVSLEAMPEGLAGQAQTASPASPSGGAATHPGGAVFTEVILSGTLEGISKIVQGAIHKRVVLEGGVDSTVSMRLQGAFNGPDALEQAFLQSLEAHGLAYEAGDSEIRIHQVGK